MKNPHGNLTILPMEIRNETKVEAAISIRRVRSAFSISMIWCPVSCGALGLGCRVTISISYTI